MVSIRLDTDVTIALRDGTATRANIWRPMGRGAFPAIVIRTPYTKEVEEVSPLLDPRRAAAAGFAIVSQDVRGTGGSGGVLTPFSQEITDGADTIAAVSEMGWCTGEVVMAGSSYVGATQWLAAAARPPALRAIAPAMAASRYDEGWTYRTEVLELAFVTSWIAGALVAPELRWLDDVERAYVDRVGVLAMAPWSAPWFESPPGTGYWNDIAVGSAGVPVLHIGGWYDIFLDGTLRAFAHDDDRRSRLIIGPWQHDGFRYLVGEENVGFAGSADGFGVFDPQLEFYRAVISGVEPSVARVCVYVLGARRWLESECWAPPHASTRELGLEGGGRFRHDPGNPVPALGGRGHRVYVAGGPGSGPVDHRSLAARTDVITLSTQTLRETLLLAGPASVRLEVGLEGCGTADWICTLCIEHPDGRLINLSEGIRCAGDECVLVEVALGDVCVELARGTTLRVLVGGASYPRWEPLGHVTRQVVKTAALYVTAINIG